VGGKNRLEDRSAGVVGVAGELVLEGFEIEDFQDLGLVEGAFDRAAADDRGEVDAPIGRSARTPTKMAVAAGGRSARTGFTVLERHDLPRPTTLLELSLQSGRTHQIRVHMAAIGHPVVGDARYGTPERALGSGRFFLHASTLAFTHPSSGERMEFSAPLPADLESFLGGLVHPEDVGVEGEGG